MRKRGLDNCIYIFRVFMLQCRYLRSHLLQNCCMRESVQIQKQKTMNIGCQTLHHGIQNFRDFKCCFLLQPAKHVQNKDSPVKKSYIKNSLPLKYKDPSMLLRGDNFDQPERVTSDKPCHIVDRDIDGLHLRSQSLRCV